MHSRAQAAIPLICSHSMSHNANSSPDLLEECNRGAKVIAVVLLRYRCHAIDCHHVRARFRTQAPHVHVLTALDADHVLLTALRRQAALGIVVEERVQTGAVDEDVGGGVDA